MGTVVDECADRLRRAGRSMGDTQLDDGTWFVSGSNGENVIEARAATQSEAWREAAEQASTLGMCR
jgi:hypothetical protein